MTWCPSEKWTEILFNRYFLQSFNYGEITFYAPTSVEEYEKGYDAKLTASDTFHEVYLQFKRPEISKTDGRFRCRLTHHQHKNLLKRPNGSAFYVSHSFRTMQELLMIQQEVKSAREFLRHFIFVDISSLRADARAIVYERGSTGLPCIVRQAYSKHQVTQRQGPIISSKYFCKGGQFMSKFKSQELGVSVELIADGSALCPTETDVPEAPVKENKRAWETCRKTMRSISAVGAGKNGKTGDFGCMLRLTD